MIAIDYVKEQGWSKVWIECDSLLTLLAFPQEVIVPRKLRSQWCVCTKFCCNIQITLSHIYLERNVCADKLVKHTLFKIDLYI
ncbi:hypothetical protein Fmac_001279 [Flemingia macrophylla]|uniref:RNase H type-1 domain-containing protein n=1 Tax=Flemingia macrophylla TaxID=520843 RepID=A0ABD1NGN7_9FABA